MSELVIHVIPEAYWGGRGPKTTRRKDASSTPGMATTSLPGRKISPRALFLIIISIAFLAVVAIAAWYFTKPLRAPSANLQPVVEVPAELTETPQEQTPIPPEEELAELPPVPTLEPTQQIPEAPSPLEDTDRDGLSNAEEIFYHSGQTQPDTDKDGFLDGHEVINLYNPSGNAPERLEEAGLAQRFVNQEGGYRLLIPVEWTAQTTVGSTTISIIDQGGQAVFKVDINDNPQGVNLEEWYKGLSESGQTQVTAWTTNKSGLRGILGGNRISGYFAKGNNIVFALEYAFGSSPGPYHSTFEMMLNSFTILE